MATFVSVSTKELERVANLAYQGETLKVMLCNLVEADYTAETGVGDWQTFEVSGNGYVRFSEELLNGAYDSNIGAFVIPDVYAEFTASGVGYAYNRIIIYIDGAAYPHSVITESPNIYLQTGQTQTYKISLRHDD